MTHYHIYGIGAALVDTEIEVSDADLQSMQVEKGVMTLVDENKQNDMIAHLSDHLTHSKRASGGSAANSIIGAAYLGAKTFYSCRVANDENGKFYLQDLADAGVGFHSNNGMADGITGKCLVLITPDAERSMNTFLGTSEFIDASAIDSEALKQSQYAYIEGYLVTSETGRPAAIELRQQAEKEGVKTALSLSDPAIVKFFRDGLIEMIGEKGVDLLFCNEDEALNFTQTTDLDDAKTALKAYAKSYAITLGSRGAWVFDGQNGFFVEATAVEALDTNGAGDMFAGAFLYAVTHGKDYEYAAKLATRSAAKVVSQFGPRLKPEQYRELAD